MDWEWVTRVVVNKEGRFTRSGLDEVDEAEIFEGKENSLTMDQSYTHEFQCQYHLHSYPFDTQVHDKLVLDSSGCFIFYIFNIIDTY